jgi:hypothetical protein
MSENFKLPSDSAASTFLDRKISRNLATFLTVAGACDRSMLKEFCQRNAGLPIGRLRHGLFARLPSDEGWVLPALGALGKPAEASVTSVAGRRFRISIPS